MSIINLMTKKNKKRSSRSHTFNIYLYIGLAFTAFSLAFLIFTIQIVLLVSSLKNIQKSQKRVILGATYTATTIYTPPPSSQTVNTDLVSLSQKSFQLGPGTDREVFFVNTNGQGTLSLTVNWSGTADTLNLEVFPTQWQNKDTANLQGYNTESDFQQAFGVNIPSTDDLTQIENLIDQTNPIFSQLEEQSDTSPLIYTINLDPELLKEVSVEIINESENEEAQGTLLLGGTASVTSFTQKAVSPPLTPLLERLLPIITHHLEFTLQQPTFQQAINVSQTQASQTWQTYTPSQILKNSITKSRSFFKKLNSSFNTDVLGVLQKAKDAGGLPTSEDYKQIMNIMKPFLPPITPKNLTFPNKYTKTSNNKWKLMLKWDRSLGASGYKLESALRPTNLANIGQLQFSEVKTINEPYPNATSQFIFYAEIPGGEPNKYCYRIKAFNNNGASGLSNIVCPYYNIPTAITKYSVEWESLDAWKESTFDDYTNSDEPYIVFVIINGVDSSGKLKLRTKIWDDSDDVDSGEIEPDSGPAHFALVGMSSVLQNSGEVIDSKTGMIINAIVMEEDDVGEKELLVFLLQSQLQSISDTIQQLALADPKAIDEYLSEAFAFTALQFLLATDPASAFGMSNLKVDDFVGSATWQFSYGNAWNLAPPQDAWLEYKQVDGGSQGKYQIGFCLFPEGTTLQKIQTRCTTH